VKTYEEGLLDGAMSRRQLWGLTLVNVLISATTMAVALWRCER
jgi:hypothetical protein